MNLGLNISGHIKISNIKNKISNIHIENKKEHLPQRPQSTRDIKN
jgi:hypothetical protein